MQPTSKLGTVFLALTLSGLAVVGAVAGDETEPVAFDLTLHRGKTVYLDFWASWCAPCRDSFSFMNAMSERYSDQPRSGEIVHLRQILMTFGTVAPEKPALPYPAVGSGRRVIYANRQASVWFVEATGELAKTHQVSGRRGVPAPDR